MGRLFSVLAVAGIAMAGCILKPGANEPGAQLVRDRCTRCHPVGVKKAHSTRDDWERTVTRMMEKGVVLSPLEKTQVVDYLSKYHTP